LRRTSLTPALLALLALVMLTACSGSGTSTATTAKTTTTALTFAGDPQSAFCTSEALRKGVPDPFADPSATPEQLRARFAEVRAALATLAPLAPEELTKDMKDVQSGIEVLGSFLERVGFDLGRAAAESTDADRAKFDDPRYAAAGVRLAAYVKQVCKIER
jgi:hypothetical protein